jgi:hypothetical protein
VFNDTPAGFDAGADSGLVATDSGLQIVPAPLPLACTAISVAPGTTTPTTPNPPTITVTSLTPPSSSSLALASQNFMASIAPAGCLGNYTFAPIWSLNIFDSAQVVANTTTPSQASLNVISPIAGPLTVSASGGY